MSVQTLEDSSYQLLKLRQVMAMTCLARSTVYMYCANNRFPKPIQLGRRNVAWVKSEVQDWIEQKVEQRDLTA